MNIQEGKLNKSRKVEDITVLLHNSHLKKAVCLKGKLKFHNNSGFEKVYEFVTVDSFDFN